MVLLIAAPSWGLDIPARRRDQFGTDLSYYLYPIAGEIPGMGTAAGFGGSVLNIGNTDTDFTAFKIDGDFSASGYTLLDIPLVERHLLFDVGAYDFDVSAVSYHRGLDSDPNDFILPRAQGSYMVGQLTWTVNQRRFEAYVRGLGGSSRVLEVRDRDGNPFSTVDHSKHDAAGYAVGGSIDLTDDRLDPRRGVRFELSAKQPTVQDRMLSDFYVTDLNLTGYLPMRRHDTMVFNYFQSDANVTRQGETDFATLQAQRGLGCDAIADPTQKAVCVATEAKFLNEVIAGNRYGTATSIGGTQRLRSYDNGRFYAGHVVSLGAEYRWNLTDENTPFDVYVAKGVRTGIQLALFAERGSVADRRSDLWDRQKVSYGAGLRVILSGVVIRGDWATGDEGETFQLFITYPWSMFSVDNPG